jgi:hypothetical protein
MPHRPQVGDFTGVNRREGDLLDARFLVRAVPIISRLKSK